MQRFLYSATSILALVTAANAQETGNAWDGWYISGQFGVSQHKTTYEDIDYDWYGSTMDIRSFGGLAGVGGGYNLVRNNTLMGLAADLSFLTNSRHDIFSTDVQIQNDADLLATLRGRVGHVVGDTVVYTTAGLAYANFERSWIEFEDIPDSWPDLGAGKLGVALGFGVEQAVNERLSIGGSFITSIYGENDSTNELDYTLRINDRIHTLAVTANYRLGDIASQQGATPAYGTPADFSGAYAGARLNGGFADIATSDIDFNNHGGTYDVGNTAATGAILGGYNWQLGATVVGVELNAAFGDMSASYEAYNGDVSTSMDQVISLRGRAGMAAGNTLLYVLGGISAAEVENSINDSNNEMNGTYTGLTVGAGVEQFFSGNLSWTAEASYTLFDGTDDAGSGDDAYYGTADLTSVSAGLNYYIGGDSRANGTGALAPSHDWSGAYAGADFALLANEGSVWDLDYDEYGGSFEIVSLGAGLGGHAGYNWQNGSFVYGVVGDLAVYSNDEAQRSSDYREVVSAINVAGSLRGRAGIASGDSLFFATAGLGFVQSDLAHNRLPAPDVSSYDLSDTRVGGIVGLGVEHALSDTLSVKVEALYFASNSDEYTQDPVQECSGPVGFDGGDCAMIGTDTNLSLKVGVSYAF